MRWTPALALVAALPAAAPGPARADFACRIAEGCRAGDICRPAPEPIPLPLREGTESWSILAPGLPPVILTPLTERGALPFIAVSAEAQGIEAAAPSALSLVIGADGTLTIAEIDLAPGVAVATVYRGTCEPD
jgi:hypothetical protein